MVQLIVGNKGKGKTKQLLDRVNSAIKEANGNIVYLDKSSKHMYPHILSETAVSLSVLSAVLYLRITIWNKCIWTVF